MGRPPRIDIAGGVYHVMNRGGAHRTIFHNAGDGTRFLALLGDSACRFQVKVLAYCLMTNHYHLLVSCPDAGLSDFMHRIGSLYARHHNDRLERDGPIFRARFHSLFVDTDEYLACAGRYIHRNPLDIRPDEPLDRYRWSSYRYYVTPARPPEWLSTSELLSQGETSTSYRAFVQNDAEHGPLDWAIDTAILEAECDDITTTNLKRIVRLALLAMSEGSSALPAEETVEFGSASARYSSMYRTRRTLEAHPELRHIAARAFELATSRVVPGTTREVDRVQPR